MTILRLAYTAAVGSGYSQILLWRSMLANAEHDKRCAQETVAFGLTSGKKVAGAGVKG